MAGQYRWISRFAADGEWVRPGLAAQLAGGIDQSLSDYRLEQAARGGLIRVRVDAHGHLWYHGDDCRRLGSANKQRDTELLKIRAEAMTAIARSHQEATGQSLADVTRAVERGRGR